VRCSFVHAPTTAFGREQPLTCSTCALPIAMYAMRFAGSAVWLTYRVTLVSTLYPVSVTGTGIYVSGVHSRLLSYGHPRMRQVIIRAKPSQPGTGKVPSYAKPSQAKPSQAKPSLA